MTWQAWTGLGGFGALMALILLDIPIGVAMGVVGLAGLAALIGGGGAFATLKVVGHGELMSYGLSVVPLFVLMGVFAARAGLSAQLFRAANAFLGHRRGGLTVATIAAAAGFSAICGSSLATAATMGKVALPEMRAYGYDPGFSAGTVAAGGTLGILIPPSIMMIVYSIITETPLLGLFAGALVPGALAVAFYVCAILIVTARRPEIAPPTARVGWGARLRGLRDAGAVIAIFLLVIGGIYGGIFTPTEAASVGAFLTGGVFIATQGLDLAGLREALLETAGTHGDDLPHRHRGGAVLLLSVVLEPAARFRRRRHGARPAAARDPHGDRRALPRAGLLHGQPGHDDPDGAGAVPAGAGPRARVRHERGGGRDLVRRHRRHRHRDRADDAAARASTCSSSRA